LVIVSYDFDKVDIKWSAPAFTGGY